MSARARLAALLVPLALAGVALATKSPAPAAAGASPAPTATATAVPAQLYVRGNFLAIDQGYLFFTNGNAVRLGAGVRPPKSVRLGRAIRITLDTATATVGAIETTPTGERANEIDASDLPSRYAVLTPAPSATSNAGATGSALGTGPVTIQFNVSVPGNTPPGDDIYIATDRSNFSPAEIHMQRSDPQHWTASLTLPGGTAVHYEYTRGTYATVERDRFGGIIAPRGVPSAGKTDDDVARWADLN